MITPKLIEVFATGFAFGVGLTLAVFAFYALKWTINGIVDRIAALFGRGPLANDSRPSDHSGES